MARPITPTPTLKGEDAKRFVAAAENPQLFYPPVIDNAKKIKEIKRKILARGEKSI